MDNRTNGAYTAVAVMILIALAWLGSLVAVMAWERLSSLWGLSALGRVDFIPANLADLAIVVLKTAILLIWSSIFLAVGMLADAKGRSIAGWLTAGVLALPLLPAVLLLLACSANLRHEAMMRSLRQPEAVNTPSRR